jgi:hypothetical protein
MKTISSKDAIELSLESYIQGYKDAIKVLEDSARELTIEKLRENLQKKIEQNKEAGVVVRE